MLIFKQLLKSKGLDYMHCVGPNPYIRGEYNVKHINLKGQQYSKENNINTNYCNVDNLLNDYNGVYKIDKIFSHKNHKFYFFKN